jgi:signal transduction histidine kinase
VNIIKKLAGLSQRYASALRRHLSQAPRDGSQPALRLGRQALALGLETLQLARIHDRAFASLQLSVGQDGQTRRAEIFFADALTPIVETHRTARQGRIDLGRLNHALNRRTLELADTNRQLRRGILRRKSVEAALKNSGEHHSRLLRESLQLQEGLRHLTHRLLAAQEDERRTISSELRNDIAQTLLGLNVRLLSLKEQARRNSKGLKNEIADTQRLVLLSAQSVWRVARQFKKT